MSFGTLTDYVTGTAIRPATAQEWRKTADRLGDPGDGYTGAWQDEDGRAVYVDGGPDTDVSPSDISTLALEGAEHGDPGMADLCEQALAGDDTDNPAWDRCREVILDNRANAVA